MSLRIACDLDGTVADMDGALQREAKRLFGPDVDLHASEAPIRAESAEDIERELEASEPSDDVPLEPSAEPATPPDGARTRPMTAGELRRLWNQVEQVENFWTTLEEIEAGAIARLHTLAVTNRWEVIFLTQRPASAGELVQTQTHRWLQARGFETPSVFVMRGGSRGKVAEALGLDAVIDDRPENCLDVVTDSKAKSMLVWRMAPETVPAGVPRTGIEVVYSMGEALDRLERLVEERRRRRGLIGRLREAFAPGR